MALDIYTDLVRSHTVYQKHRVNVTVTHKDWEISRETDR